MTRGLLCVLSPDPDAGEPFIVTDALTVREAAMIYRDRHPAGRWLSTVNIFDPEHIATLERWIGRRDPPAVKLLGDLRAQPAESDQERDRRISWEVASELSTAIDNHKIAPVHTERDPQGRTIHLACIVQLADLLAIARKRGDAGEIISSMTNWYEPAKSEPPALPPSRLKPFWGEAEAAAMSWLAENGCPRPRDRHQAVLEKFVAEWLAAHGWEAGETTIRRHVRCCIERFRKSLAA